MNTWFANLSVTRKLALGFGLVLALTLILASVAWTSMGGLIQRSNWTADINHLSNLLTELRVDRLRYMLDNGDEKMAEVVQKSLASYSNAHADVRSRFRSEENVRLLAQQAEQIELYKQSFNRVSAARKTFGCWRNRPSRSNCTSNPSIAWPRPIARHALLANRWAAWRSRLLPNLRTCTRRCS